MFKVNKKRHLNEAIGVILTPISSVFVVVIEQVNSC